MQKSDLVSVKPLAKNRRLFESIELPTMMAAEIGQTSVFSWTIWTNFTPKYSKLFLKIQILVEQNMHFFEDPSYANQNFAFRFQPKWPPFRSGDKAVGHRHETDGMILDHSNQQLFDGAEVEYNYFI